MNYCNFIKGEEQNSFQKKCKTGLLKCSRLALLVVMCLLALGKMEAQAVTIPTTDTTGNVIWKLDTTAQGDSVLTLCATQTNYAFVATDLTVIATEAGLTGATSVSVKFEVIENGAAITGIGESAFKGCTYLTSIALPNGITAIADSTFEGCNKLATITGLEAVTTIGAHAFYNVGVTNSPIAELNFPAATTAGIAAFRQAKIASIKLPALTGTVADSLFSQCTELTTISIGTKVTSIKKGTFYGVRKLEALTIPASVTSIGDGAFASGSTNATITIQNTSAVVTLGTGTVGGTNTKIIVPDDLYDDYIVAENWTSVKDKIFPAGLPEGGYTVSFENLKDAEGNKTGTITGTYKVGEDGTSLTTGTAVPWGSEVTLTLELATCYDLEATDSWTKTIESNTTDIVASDNFVLIEDEDGNHTLTFTLKEVGNVTFSANVIATTTTYSVTATSEGADGVTLDAAVGDSLFVSLSETVSEEGDYIDLDNDGKKEFTATDCGSTVYFTAKAPADGCYEIDHWVVQIGEETETTPYKKAGETENFTGETLSFPLTSDYAVSVFWKLKKYEITANLSTNVEPADGETEPSIKVEKETSTEVTLEEGKATIDCGTKLTFTATAGDAFLFKNWQVSEEIKTQYELTEEELHTSPLVIDAIKGDFSVTANFVAGTEDDIKIITADIDNKDASDTYAEDRGTVTLNGEEFSGIGLTTAEGINQYLEGDEIVLTAVPDACSEFVGWFSKITNPEDAATDSTTMNNANPVLTVKVADDSVKYTAVFGPKKLNIALTVSPRGVAAAPTFALTTPANPEQEGFFCEDDITVTLGKLGNTCYKFIGFVNAEGDTVTQAKTDGTLTYDMKLEGDTALTVLYAPIKYQVTYTGTSDDTGTLSLTHVNGEYVTSEQQAAWTSGSLSVDCGTKLVVQPKPVAGHKFTSLYMDGNTTRVNPMPNETDKYEIIVSAGTNLVAKFDASNTSRVAWKTNNGAGSIKVTGTTLGTSNVLPAVQNNTKLSFEATEDSDNLEFLEWQISTQEGTSVSDKNPLELTVARDVIVTAVFKSAIATGASSIVEMGNPAAVESDGTPVYDKLVQKPVVAVDGSKLALGATPGKVEVIIYEWDDAKDPINHLGKEIYKETISLTNSADWQGQLQIAAYGNGRAIMVTAVYDGAGTLVTTETTAFKMDNVKRPIIKRILDPEEDEEEAQP